MPSDTRLSGVVLLYYMLDLTSVLIETKHDSIPIVTVRNPVCTRCNEKQSDILCLSSQACVFLLEKLISGCSAWLEPLGWNAPHCIQRPTACLLWLPVLLIVGPHPIRIWSGVAIAYVSPDVQDDRWSPLDPVRNFCHGGSDPQDDDCPSLLIRILGCPS